MKTTKFLFYFTLAGFAFLLGGCSKSEDDMLDVYINQPEVFRKDVNTYGSYAMLKEEFTLEYIRISSANFSTTPFTATATKAQLEDMFKKMEAMLAAQEEAMEAIRKLEESGILDRVTTRGPIDAFAKFGEYLSGAGKRRREASQQILQHLSNADKTLLYNNLPASLCEGTKNEADFWSKFNKGDLDHRATQIWNQFYHTADSDFGTISAMDYEETIASVFHGEGAMGLEAGADLMVEAFGTVSGMGVGMTLVNIVDQATQLGINGYNMNVGDRQKLQKALASNMASYLSRGFVSGDMVLDAFFFITDKAKSSRQTDTDIENSDNYGRIKVRDLDNADSRAEVVIARRIGAGTGPAVYVITGSKKDSYGIDIINVTLPPGTWMLTCIDKNGNRATRKITIRAGDVDELEIDTFKDDGGEGEASDDPNLYGSWIWEEESEYFYTKQVMIFEKNGNGKVEVTDETPSGNDFETYAFTYSYHDGKLEIKFKVQNNTWNVTVHKLTKTEFSFTDPSDGYKYNYKRL